VKLWQAPTSSFERGRRAFIVPAEQDLFGIRPGEVLSRDRLEWYAYAPANAELVELTLIGSSARIAEAAWIAISVRRYGENPGTWVAGALRLAIAVASQPGDAFEIIVVGVAFVETLKALMGDLCDP
jgi:hypothetical protein